MNGTRHGKKFWNDEQENFGFKALQKMGWTPGTGVGKKGQGMTKCIGMVVKNDNAGIGGKNTNVSKHRAIVSMYNDILKKANKPKGEKKSPSLSVEGYMAKNALYRRFRIATTNEFKSEETEVILPSKKRKKKKKKEGFTWDDQERIALAQADLRNSGKKGLGFGKIQTPVSLPKTEKQNESVTKDKKKKKKKKRKRAESSPSSENVGENFLDGLLCEIKKNKMKRVVAEESTNDAVESVKKSKKKKKKRKLKDAEDKPAKRRKVEEPVADSQPDESGKKMKKKKKRKTLTIEASSIEPVRSKKKKKKKSKTAEAKVEAAPEQTKSQIKKKKKKKKKQKQ